MHAIFRTLKQFNSGSIFKRNQLILKQVRNVTALYITGDKAKENYATLHPYMNFENVKENWELLEQSIEKRNWQDKVDLKAALNKYNAFQDHKSKINKLEKKREEVASHLRQLSSEKNTTTSEVDQLKAQGKQLRQEVKSLKESFYSIEGDFAQAYLNIPNILHPACGVDGKEKLIFRNGLSSEVKAAPSHMERSDLVRYINPDRYYMYKDAATFDVYATQALTRYFVHDGDFLQMANPDFVRRVLLEANATPIDQYHQVIEQQLQNQLNFAYLAGGASFESFLAGVTRLYVYPNVLPLRYVCCGRSYEKVTKSDVEHDNLFTATQTNAVQTFVATETAKEADEQFEEILNLAINFYKSLNIHFRIVYADASKLTAAECVRASIEVFSPFENRYVCVGRISNFGDYVSKRILFCMHKQKQHHFPHMIGGTVMYTTRLIAAMIENGLPLDYTKLLGMNDLHYIEQNSRVIDEFKNIFK